MKRICCFVLVLLLTITLIGCNSNNISDEGKKTPSAEPGIIGYVMNKVNNGILVVSQEAQDFSSTGGVDEFYNAIWFSNAPKDIKIGDKVKVWYDAVRESYPGQSEIKHVEVVSSQKPKGADLTQAEALNKALTVQDIIASEVMVVKALEYDKEKDEWNIKLKEALGDKTYNVQVEDK